MASATDNFNRTAETPLSTGWGTASGFPGCDTDGAEAFGHTAAVNNISIYTGTSFGGDQFAETTWGSHITPDAGPVVRGSTSVVKGYWLTDDDNGFWNVSKITAGPTVTGIANGAWPSPSVAGDVIRLEVTATATTVLRVFRNGTEDFADGGSLTDTSSPHTTGQPGIGIVGVDPKMTAWAGGDLSANTNVTPTVGAATLTGIAPARVVGTVITPVTP